MKIKLSSLLHGMAGLALAVVLVTPGFAADKKYTTEKQKFSYAIGIQIGNNLKRQGVDNLDKAALSQAIIDAMKGNKFKVSVEDMKAAIQSFQQKLAAAEKKKSETAKAAGDKFRAEYKKKKGVTELANGIMYKVIKSASGQKPTVSNTVSVNYKGSLTSGKVFDSSYDRGKPVTFPLGGVIKGWQEVLPLMSTGEKWEVVIPPELGYGEQGAGSSIGPNETLVFEIELLEIKKEETKAPETK